MATAPAVLPAASATGARRWWMLAALLLGQLMAIADVFIVNIAVPRIGDELHASGATLQLVVAGYTVTYAMLLIAGARLGAVLGRRRMYLAGVLVFTAASLGCALAPGGGALVALRCVQGAGAAMLVPQIISVIQTRFTGQDRVKALSAFGGVLACGAVTGLILGGVLVDADLFGLTWRPAFFVNVVPGALLLFVLPRVMPADPPVGKPRLDVAGLLTAATAVLLIVLTLTFGRQLGWPAWTFAALAAGLAVAAGFVALEQRIAARGGAPLLNLAVFRAPGLRPALVVLAVMTAGYGGFLFSFTLHLQTGLGVGPLSAGLTYLPLAVVFGLAGYHWRRLPARVQPLVTPAGLVCCTLGYLGLAVALPGGGDGGALAVVSQMVAGLGMGLTASPVLGQALLRVPPERAADASGVLTTAGQLSQVLGVAGFGTLYFSVHGTSSAAIATTCLWLAVVSAAGVGAAVVLARTVRRTR